jgi:hypothetical protein
LGSLAGVICRLLWLFQIFILKTSLLLNGSSKAVLLPQGMVDSNNDPTFIDIPIPANTSNTRHSATLTFVATFVGNEGDPTFGDWRGLLDERSRRKQNWAI